MAVRRFEISNLIDPSSSAVSSSILALFLSMRLLIQKKAMEEVSKEQSDFEANCHTALGMLFSKLSTTVKNTLEAKHSDRESWRNEGKLISVWEALIWNAYSFPRIPKFGAETSKISPEEDIFTFVSRKDVQEQGIELQDHFKKLHKKGARFRRSESVLLGANLTCYIANCNADASIARFPLQHDPPQVRYSHSETLNVFPFFVVSKKLLEKYILNFVHSIQLCLVTARASHCFNQWYNSSCADIDCTCLGDTRLLIPNMLSQ
jgi:hypothetical protein